MDVKVSEGITDQRAISREDIASIEKTPADEIAYSAIRSVKPLPNAFSPGVYDKQIAAMQAFITGFPESPHRAEAQQTLQAFQEEKARLDKDEFKLNGKWLSRNEAEKEHYEIAAEVALDSMRDLTTARDYIGALNAFDQLEKLYPGSRAYPDAVDLAKGILAALRTDIDRRLEACRHDERERVAGVQLASEPHKSELIAAAKAEQDRYNAIFESSKSVKWMPIVPRSEKILLALQTLIPGEASRLSLLPIDKMRESIRAAGEAERDIAAKDSDKADADLKQATVLWPANHQASAVLVPRLVGLKAAMSKSAASQHATPKTSPKPSPRSVSVSTPISVSTSSATDAGSGGGGVVSFIMSIPGALTVLGAVVLVAGGVAIASKRGKEVPSE